MPQYASFTQLPGGSSARSTDIYAAVDTVDVSPSAPRGTLKQYTLAQLQSFIVNSFTGSALETVYVASPSNLSSAYDNGTSGIGATLTQSGFGPWIIDGVTLVLNQRVLVANQTSTLENGIYIVTNAGSVSTQAIMTRAPDFNGSTLGTITQGDFVGVLKGSLFALTFWFLESPTPLVIGVDAIIFQQQSQTEADAWVVQTTPSVTMAVNTGYTSSAGATNVSFTLPPVCAPGEWIEVNGEAPGLYNILVNPGQTIFFGNTQTTPIIGAISSASTHSAIKIRCILANTNFEVVSFTGSFGVV